MSLLDRQNRAPTVNLLPDRRQRVTRYVDAINSVSKSPDAIANAGLWYAWGLQDDEYTNCRLIKQDIEGQTGKLRDPVDESCKLVLVFEEIAATTETLVGNPDVTINQYGYKEVTLNWIQFSAGTATYQVPGTTTAPSPFSDCLLREQIATDDGTLRTIKRIYVEGGILSDIEELRFNGKVKIRTLKSLIEEPSTPTGYTLVTTSIEYYNGCRVWAKGFATAAAGGGAGGVISTSTEYKISPDQGTAGVTVVTIEQVAAPGISNPIVSPGAGYELIELKQTEESGYVLWRAVYAAGTGLIVDDKDIKDGGNLIIYRRVAINAVPSAPSATIGGTVNLIEDNERNGTEASSGTIVYSRTWAEGEGVPVSEIEYQNNGKLVLYHKVGYGTTPPAPSPTIGGTVVEVSVSERQVDGYAIYDVRWAEGVGEISRDIEYAQSSDQGTTGVTRTTIRYLVAPAATIQPTSLSGSVLVGQKYTDSQGYRVWETNWGKGTGLVVDEVDTQLSTALIVYHRIALGGAPATPSATIGGTVTLFESSVRQDSGYAIYDYRWAEGDGQASIETRAQADGALIYIVTTMNAAAVTPAYPGSGTAYLVNLEQAPRNGYYRNTAVYHKPPATITLKKLINFKMPGLASFVSDELIVSPPSDRTILADLEISYGTTQNSTTPFSVLFGAYYKANYIRENNNDVGESEQRSLAYILASAGSSSGTSGTYNGMACVEWNATLSSSSPVSRPSGATTIDVDNQIYLVAIDGTVVYRRLVTTYSF